MIELLTPAQMGEADRLTIAGQSGAGGERVDFGEVTGIVQPAHA